VADMTFDELLFLGFKNIKHGSRYLINKNVRGFMIRK
jgi:hypothetical protein